MQGKKGQQILCFIHQNDREYFNDRWSFKMFLYQNSRSGVKKKNQAEVTVQ